MCTKKLGYYIPTFFVPRLHWISTEGYFMNSHDINFSEINFGSPRWP